MFSHAPFDKLLLKSPINLKDKKNITPPIFTPKPQKSSSTQYKSYTSEKCKNQQIKIQDAENNKKILAISFKRIINSTLLSAFQLIFFRVRVKAISFQLLQTKQKRNLQQAFLQISLITQNQRQKMLQISHQTKRNPKLIVLRLQKAENTLKNYSFMKLKSLCKRKRLLQIFCHKLQNCFQSYKNVSIYKVFWSIFLQQNSIKCRKLITLKNVLILDKKRLHRLKVQTFKKIINYIIYTEYQSQFFARKDKNRQILQVSSSRKKQITEQKQKLKKLKMTYDQLNLQKNRSKNQLKKSRNNVQMQFNFDIKNLNKDIQQRNLQIQGKLAIHQQKHRLFSLRQKNRTNSFDCQNKVKIIYKNLEQQEQEQIKNISYVVPSLQLQLYKFQQTNDFYFWENIKLNQQVYIYQKIRKMEEGVQFYNKVKQQNQNLKALVRTISMHEIEKAVNSFILKQESQSTQTPTQSIKSLPKSSRRESGKIRDEKYYINIKQVKQ